MPANPRAEKGQVMWMAKRPNGALVPALGAARSRGEMVGILCFHYGAIKDLRREGWRIVKVEVREVRRGK